MKTIFAGSDAPLNEDAMLTAKCMAVVKAFLNHEPGESAKLATDGVRLDGLWMGGTGIAQWDKGHVYFNDLGSNAAAKVQKAVVKMSKPGVVVEDVGMLAEFIKESDKEKELSRFFKEATREQRDYAARLFKTGRVSQMFDYVEKVLSAEADESVAMPRNPFGPARMCAPAGRDWIEEAIEATPPELFDGSPRARELREASEVSWDDLDAKDQKRVQELQYLFHGAAIDQLFSGIHGKIVAFAFKGPGSYGRLEGAALKKLGAKSRWADFGMEGRACVGF